MKKNICLLFGIISFALLSISCDNDDNGGSAVNITIKGAENISGDIFVINVTEDQPKQLEAFIMPQTAKGEAVSYKLAGTSSGAITISENGLITPLLSSPAEGDIPLPLGTDTIIAMVNDGSGTFVRYPVRVISKVKLVSSITIQSAGQNPEIEPGKTFELSKFVTVNPTDATDNTVSYSSEDETIATVTANGVITAVGEIGQSTNIMITANDRTKKTASCLVTIIAEPPLYVEKLMTVDMLSSNLPDAETASELKHLLDDNNATFWGPKIEKRPNYSPACYLDIDFGEVIKYAQLHYKHRSLNYGHLQLRKFTLQGKKTASDEWIDLGEYITTPLQVSDYQVFGLGEEEEGVHKEIQYLRINFIQGHLRAGKPDWNYEEDGNVSVGDIKVFIYNR